MRKMLYIVICLSTMLPLKGPGDTHSAQSFRRLSISRVKHLHRITGLHDTYLSQG